MRAGREPGRCPLPRGFTLIEMIVVLAVLALVLGIVLTRGPVRSARLELDGAARTVATALRAARAEAIARDHPVRVTLDAAAHEMRIGAAAPRMLPPEFALTITPALGGAASKPITAIAFLPDGSSSGGRILIASAQRRVLVGVDWLTGRVSIADAAVDDAK